MLRSWCCTEILIHFSSGISQELIAIDRDSSRNFGGDLGILAYNCEGFVINLYYL